MAWITKKRGSYGVGWRDLRGHERWSVCANAKAARALRSEVETNLQQGRDWEPNRPRQATKLDEVLRCFVRTRCADLRPRTIERYAVSLDLVLQFVRSRHGRGALVDVLSRALLEDFSTWLSRAEHGRHGHPRKRVTVVKTVQCLERVWAWAEQSERWPDLPPPRQLGLRRLPPPRRWAVTYEEWDQMLQELKGAPPKRPSAGVAQDWPYRAALLARYTGARRLALLQLTWGDVELDELRIELRDETTKGGYSGRTIPLHPRLAQVLRGWRHVGTMVIAAPTSELTGRGHVDRYLRRAWKRARVREQAWFGQPLHVARRTLRTHLVTQGIQADIIDAITGHRGQGTGGRVYTDRDARWLWAPLMAAMATIPAHKE